MKVQVPAKVEQRLITDCQAAAAKRKISFAKYLAEMMAEELEREQFEHEAINLLEDIKSSVDNPSDVLSPALIEVLMLLRTMANAPTVKSTHSIMRQLGIAPVEISNVK